MFDTQWIIVALILTLAVGYAVVTFWKKAGSFSAKSGCGNDCGCSGKTKNTIH